MEQPIFCTLADVRSKDRHAPSMALMISFLGKSGRHPSF
jgi:hypothetical protein